jgi:hypothetical protein
VLVNRQWNRILRAASRRLRSRIAAISLP